MRKASIVAATAALVAVLAIPLASAAPVERLEATLRGIEEVPGPGDPNGRGEAFVKANKPKRKICFRLSFRRIGPPTAGHIHRGADGVAGPVRVTLFEDAAGLPVPGEVEGCVKDLRRRLVRNIANHPRRFYVNLHNEEFPDGAIRGQLEPAS